MIGLRKFILPLLPGVVFAGMVCAQGQDQILKQGEQTYAVTCATGYCHTLKGGSGGGAPRLAARGFTLDYITRIVSSGVPDTRMIGFAATLPEQKLQAVIAYVASLNGIHSNGQTPIPAVRTRPRLTPVEQEGKELLHDPLRAFSRCATCHQVEGSGVPVAEPFSQLPATAEALRKIETPHIFTVTVGGESMPALVLSQGTTRTIFYDLTSPPPVRRNIDSAGIKIIHESHWRHASVIKTYSDAELDKILAYLRAVTK